MGLENIGGWELILLILVGLFIFGPERLPKAIGDGMRLLRNVRQMARNATGDLSRELGTQVELEDLHPKTFLRKHLLSEEDERALRKPLEDAYGDLRGVTDSVNSIGKETTVSPSTSTPAKPGPRPSYDDAT